jgi:bifunctional enzyme CysN/CysC
MWRDTNSVAANVSHELAAFESVVKTHEHKSVLRFITCGSVDDGKSTLIGRLLMETQNLYDDQLGSLRHDSRKHGTQGEALDYALLLDGLAAEREQGITIDVAYRFFSTQKRKFIVADCPGHEQYTRNMATGASTADLAVVLVDARKGLLTQTRRHSFIVSLLGVKHVILAVNKMDAVGYQQAVFQEIEQAYLVLAKELGIHQIHAVPVSALVGDNLTSISTQMPWYQGDALLTLLENAPIAAPATAAFRFPVQWVARPNQDFRGFAGSVVSGEVAVGDLVSVNGTNRSQSKVSSIIRGSVEVPSASIGESIILTLSDPIDVSRGDVISALSDLPARSDRFEAKLLWMAQTPLKEGQSFLLKLGTRSVNARVEEISYLIDVDSQSERSASVAAMNEVVICKIRLDYAIALERYLDSRSLGAFILIDRHEHTTVAAGTVSVVDAPRQIKRHPSLVSHQERAQQKGQRPRCIWFTGLSGAGKSTLTSALDRKLSDLGQHLYVLDGDNLRHGLTKHLGFSEVDRKENIRLVAETAKLMVDAGLIVLVSLISPFRADRDSARALFKEGEFIEVFVDTTLAVAESRDPKGLYAKARSGKLKGFTGIDAPYEAPLNPEVHLQTAGRSVQEMVAELLQWQ